MMHMKILILEEVLKNIEHCSNKEQVIAEIVSMKNESEMQLNKEGIMEECGL